MRLRWTPVKTHRSGHPLAAAVDACNIRAARAACCGRSYHMAAYSLRRAQPRPLARGRRLTWQRTRCTKHRSGRPLAAAVVTCEHTCNIRTARAASWRPRTLHRPMSPSSSSLLHRHRHRNHPYRNRQRHCHHHHIRPTLSPSSTSRQMSNANIHGTRSAPPRAVQEIGAA